MGEYYAQCFIHRESPSWTTREGGCVPRGPCSFGTKSLVVYGRYGGAHSGWFTYGAQGMVFFFHENGALNKR